MADRTGLRLLGLIFGGVTVVVLVMAATIVFAHMDGLMALDGGQAAITTDAR